MPNKNVKQRAARDRRQGKSPSTQAGEYVREEIHHVREGKHGARSPEQAIAIGLAKARRDGVRLPRQRGRKGARAVKRRKAAPAPRRSRAMHRALERESRRSAGHAALSRHARKAARKRSATSRSATARKAARTRARRK